MITLFQHGENEPAGEIETCLKERRVPFITSRLFETGVVPEKLPQGLIILGGQMSINDIRDYPFISEEKRLVREMVAAKKPVLGICLGAQIIASAFGERVYHNTREQGWVTIHTCGSNSRLIFPDTFTVFHWHNETFSLPAGAELLACGTTIENQVFRLGSAVGIQFHPEVTHEIISRWVKALEPDERKQMFQKSEHYLAMNRQLCRMVIDHFLGRVEP